MRKIITVDGPAGAGKSTVSRLLAKKLQIFYLDTGAMYRAVALQAKREGIDIDDTERLAELCRNLDLHFKTVGEENRLFIGNKDISLAIRSPEMDMLSSRISAVKEVREAMTELQRKIGREGGVVAEGRDMGTVVFPDADHKFFMTALAEVRAERRYLERMNRGESVSRAEVEIELRKRDDQDANRAIAPLLIAEDAKVIDTSALSPDQVVEIVLTEIKDGRTRTV
ncbi:MAG: (d)CMP kinase [Desulfobacteraceae bacterium]|jgi:cytidylate kinase